LERWLTQANPAGGAAGVNSSSASTSTEREIAAAWRRTQRELDAHLQRSGAGALAEADRGLARSGFGLLAMPHATHDALARISGHRLRPLTGLDEGLKNLNA